MDTGPNKPRLPCPEHGRGCGVTVTYRGSSVKACLPSPRASLPVTNSYLPPLFYVWAQGFLNPFTMCRIGRCILHLCCSFKEISPSASIWILTRTQGAGTESTPFPTWRKPGLCGLGATPQAAVSSLPPSRRKKNADWPTRPHCLVSVLYLYVIMLISFQWIFWAFFVMNCPGRQMTELVSERKCVYQTLMPFLEIQHFSHHHHHPYILSCLNERTHVFLRGRGSFSKNAPFPI